MVVVARSWSVGKMKYLMVILVGVGLILNYAFDFKFIGIRECKTRYPYCMKVEDKVR